jgi:hypothetical protein
VAPKGNRYITSLSTQSTQFDYGGFKTRGGFSGRSLTDPSSFPSPPKCPELDTIELASYYEKFINERLLKRASRKVSGKIPAMIVALWPYLDRHEQFAL